MSLGIQGCRDSGELGEFPRVRTFRDLLVWQQAIVLVKLAYKLTKSLPKDEVYGLSSQIKRAAVSIAANIAEGHTRTSTKEFLQFLSIALASLAELQTHIILTVELEFVTNADIVELDDLADKTSKMIRNLQLALRAKL